MDPVVAKILEQLHAALLKAAKENAADLADQRKEGIIIGIYRAIWIIQNESDAVIDEIARSRGEGEA